MARIDLTSAFGQGNTFTQQRHFVRVVAPDPPTNPNLRSPFLLQCNSPLYTPVCVTAGALVINPRFAPYPCKANIQSSTCTVAVENATWSSVKGLYR